MSKHNTAEPLDDDNHPDPALLALGIRQPWAELILRGCKTVEVRRTRVRHRGPIYVYASRRPDTSAVARKAAGRFGLDLETLPRGMVLGTVEIQGLREPLLPDDVEAALVSEEILAGRLCWELANPRRLSDPLAPRYLPSGIWFYPFRPRN